MTSLTGTEFSNKIIDISVSRTYSGCVRMPSMDVYPIEDIDLNLTDIQKDNFPLEIHFNIEGNFLSNIYCVLSEV